MVIHYVFFLVYEMVIHDVFFLIYEMVIHINQEYISVYFTIKEINSSGKEGDNRYFIKIYTL